MSDSKFSLIKIEGKPLEKLIDTVRSGIGTLYNPYRIRNEGKAEADRSIMLAEANAKVALIEDEANAELARRAMQRLMFQEMNKQKNIESIADNSVQYLGESVSDAPVDEGWNINFFGKAQNVTDEELQDLWSRVLAKEITTPNAIGWRTLDVLQGMTVNEAKLFEQMGKYAITGIVADLESEFWNKDSNLLFSDLLKMQDAGLLSPVPMQLDLKKLENPALIFGDEIYRFTKADQSCVIGGYRLTAAGEDLYKALQLKPDPAYKGFVIEKLSKNGYVLKDV